MAANFAIGAVLMIRFAEMAAPWFDGAEIVEYHHDGKLDAPSGTALHTAERMATARFDSGTGEFPPDRTATTVVDGARGGAGPAGVRIHSIRMSGLVAHQEVILGGDGQTLTIRHDSYDRASFMDGVVLAVVSVTTRPGLTIGLEPLLGL
jgi:4-hydroxy-tetrahydrodipicolinate reductase